MTGGKSNLKTKCDVRMFCNVCRTTHTLHHTKLAEKFYVITTNIFWIKRKDIILICKAKEPKNTSKIFKKRQVRYS